MIIMIVKIRSFTKNIFDGTITLNNADKEQIHLLIEVLEFNKNTKPRDVKKKKEKRDTLESLHVLYEGWKMVLLKLQYFHYHQMNAHDFPQT